MQHFWLFCHIFFTSHSVTQLLYIQSLNWIDGMISKNSTAEDIHMRLQISKITCGIELFLMQTVAKTNARHRNSGCCLYIRWNLKPKKLWALLHPSCYLFTLRQLVSILSPERSCFLSPFFVNSSVMFTVKKIYWRGIPSTIRYI